MKVECLSISEVKLLTPLIFRDDRGFFSETWSVDAMARAGIPAGFVQDNHALSLLKGTVRGLHFQMPPMAQDKLVRVVKGAVMDVAVDIRRGSPTYGRHVSAVLSAQNWAQMWVPKGFAHGYVTLEAATEVIYKVTQPYSLGHDRGMQWDDPALGIDWGITRDGAVVSEKDSMLPPLSELADYFVSSGARR